MLGCWGDGGDAATCWAEVTGWSRRAHVATRQRAAWPVASGGVSGLGTSPEGDGVVGQTHSNVPFRGSHGAPSTQNAAARRMPALGLSPIQLSSRVSDSGARWLLHRGGQFGAVQATLLLFGRLPSLGKALLVGGRFGDAGPRC